MENSTCHSNYCNTEWMRGGLHDPETSLQQVPNKSLKEEESTSYVYTNYFPGFPSS